MKLNVIKNSTINVGDNVVCIFHDANNAIPISNSINCIVKGICTGLSIQDNYIEIDTVGYDLSNEGETSTILKIH